MTPTEIRIFLLEESEKDCQLIESELVSKGLKFTIRRQASLDSFLKALSHDIPDVILSDYTHDDFDGLSALKEVRKLKLDVPFIFVSWPVHEDSVIEAIRAGATDYVLKSQISRLPLSVTRAIKEAAEHRELKETEELLVDQERLGALGKMASGIAHDFNNALMPIVGFTEILLGNSKNLEDKKKLEEYLGLIHTSSQDAMKIVARLRDFYRKRQKTEVFRPVDIRQVVEQAVLLTRPKWREEALSHGVAIRVDTEVLDLPKISGFDSALREVFMNLIFNAVDAMPRGGEISIHGRREQNYLVLDVADTGVGMTEQVRKHCLDPFFTTKGLHGTGLGLAMVYGAIKRHEGILEVRSTLGKGSIFTIRLPVLSAAKGLKSAPGPATPATDRVSQKQLHFLAVDDEPMSLRVIKEYLMVDGHTVETAKDGREGLAKFQSGNFDLVVTDWAMPGLSGDKLATQIKQSSPTTPVIMLTGFGEIIRAKGDQVTGVDFLLNKPPTLSAMREVIAQSLVLLKNQKYPQTHS